MANEIVEGANNYCSLHTEQLKSQKQLSLNCS